MHPHLEVVDRIPRLPPRPREAHKGMFGHALLVGGSLGMSGAIAIAGAAALRGGAGLVTLAVPSGSQTIVAANQPCAMTVALPEDTHGCLAQPAGEWLRRRMRLGTVLGMGPGLGRSPASDAITAQLFESWEEAAVFDADALNALAESEVWLGMIAGARGPSARPRILTPHPGEWSRLSGVASSDREGQIAAAAALAAKAHVVIVLKGAATFVTDGRRGFVNRTGNPSMAVGGSGDALTGLITALLCQGLQSFDATVLGVALHGLAGDIAHRTLRTPSTLPTDWLHSLPAAFRELDSESSE